MQLLPPGSDSRWPALGDQIGPWVLARDYKLEGSGEMFVARRADGAFQREVLITFLRPDASRPNARQIFEAEVELQAKLDHPGIAKVFGAGNTEGGVPYLVTEYLPGEDIEVHCDREQAPFVERIRLFRLVCEALQHAHDRGIVGINLQANNVHLMPDGSVRLVVYGLAQSNGEFATAPNWPEYARDYASPEQWRGERADQASDVYALGVLLHLLLAGFLPYDYRGLTPAEASRVANEEIPSWTSERVPYHAPPGAAADRGCSAKQLVQSLSGDLDRILAKALSIAPRSRYSSPAELAEDLDRHLNGQPIRARGRAPLYRLRRGLTRHRTALAVVLVIAASLVWALRASFHSAQRAEMALVEAQQAREESEAQGNRLRELCIRFLTELGPSMQGRKGLDEARRYLLYVGANLLDYLREAGYEDRRLRVQIARSYAQLADADWMARDRASQYRTPDSVRKAREVAASLMPPGDDPLGREIMEAWARSTRSAVWFASYEQNLPELRQWVADADALLTASGRDVNSLSVIIDSMRMEWRRTWLESELKFEEAMEAWDVARLRSKISTQPDLAPFLLADLSRMESLRAELLVRDYREEEALFELPTLVYQLRDEARSHQPPIRDLIQAECNAWVLLALARARSGLSPGDAVDEGLDSLRRFEEALDTGQSSSEAGALLHMAFAECYWTMGPENLALATGHLETSIEQWKQLLRSGARWPQYQLKLVAALELLARIQRDGSTLGSASRTLAEAYDRLGDLPSPASDSPIAVWLRLELDLIARSLPDQQERAPWAGIQERLADLERRGISSRWLLHARRQIQDQQEREQR